MSDLLNDDISNDILEISTIKSIIDNLNENKIDLLSRRVVEEIEKYNYLTGDQKKALLIIVITKLFSSLTVDDDVKSSYFMKSMIFIYSTYFYLKKYSKYLKWKTV